MPETSQFDVFISYASEERDNAARPLADFLRNLGVGVWFDEFELKIGDNLRRRIDDGLARSRFGLVLLSHGFFKRHYTNLELDGLAQREVAGVKVILPVWIDVNEDDVRSLSPPLAGRIAARWEEGLPVVAAKIIAEVRPELLQDILKLYLGSAVPRIRNGQELADLFRDSMGTYRRNDPPENAEEASFIGAFFQEMVDWKDIWSDLELGEQIEREFKLTQLLCEVGDAGWSVFGKKVRGRFDFAGAVQEWPAHLLVLARGEPNGVYLRNGEIEIDRSENNEADLPVVGV